MAYDVLLTDAWDLPIPGRHRTGPEVVAQRVEVRLRTMLGDWILDTSEGLPILTWLENKLPDVAIVGATIQAEIASTPGVVRVENMTTTLGADRVIRVSCDAEIESGEVLSVVAAPFGSEAGPLTGPTVHLSVISTTHQIAPLR